MKKYIYFTLLIALSLLVCIATFAMLAGGALNAVVTNFAVSFPMCLLLCVIYYYTALRLNKIDFLCNHKTLRIVVNWLCCTVIGTALSTAARLIIGAEDDWRIATMTFILWNSLVILGIELYVSHKESTYFL